MGQAGAGLGHDAFQPAQVQRRLGAVVQGHADAGVSLGRVAHLLVFPLLAALLAVQDVVPGHFVLAAAHQGQFDLVLNVFDMDGAAGGHAPLEGGGHLLGEFFHCLVDTGRGRRGAAFHGQEGLGDGDGDLALVVGDHGAVALDHAQLARRRGLELGLRGGVVGGL